MPKKYHFVYKYCLQQHYARLTTDEKKRSLPGWRMKSAQNMASKQPLAICNLWMGLCFEQRGARYTAAGRYLHGLPPEHDRQGTLEKGKLDPKQHLEMMNKMIKYMAEKAQKGTDW